MEGNDNESIEVNDGKFYDLGGTNKIENGEEGLLPEDSEKIEKAQENDELLNEQTERIEKKEDKNVPIGEEQKNNLELDSGKSEKENLVNDEPKVDENIDNLDDQLLEEKENDKALGNIPFTDSNIEKIDEKEVNANFFDEPGNFEQVFFRSEVNEGDSLKNVEEKIDIEGLLQEMNLLKVQNQSLVFECADKDEVIKKLKRIINNHKNDSVSALQARVNSLIDEKVKIAYENEKLVKQVKELGAKAENYKKIIESNDGIQKKRDSQLESVVNKTNIMKNEIGSLRAELQKKSIIISNLSIEVTELRPLKELRSLPEKYSKIIEELKKSLDNKDTEINMLKGLIKNLQTTLPTGEIVAKSPGKLPPIKGSRSTYSQKNILSGKTGFSSKSNIVDYSKSVNYTKEEDLKAKEEEEQEQERLRLEHIRIEKDRQLEEELQKTLEKELESQENEKKLMEAEENLINELIAAEKETQRIIKEKEREEVENTLMEIEEHLIISYEKQVAEERRAEEDKRIEEENLRKKKEEEEKSQKEAKKQEIKPKGKIAAKQGAKTGAKKK